LPAEIRGYHTSFPSNFKAQTTKVPFNPASDAVSKTPPAGSGSAFFLIGVSQSLPALCEKEAG
jgi:hypothetical protein